MTSEQTKKASCCSGSSQAICGQVFRNRGFLGCAALLAVFAIGFHILTVQWKIQFRKLPVHLQKRFKELDKEKLAPYELFRHYEIKPEILDQLGTDEYIQWLIRDRTDDGEDGPADYVNLFVTYYTGKPDQVPHVPEVCYLGSGYKVIGQELIEVAIPALGEGFTIPMQVLEFERSALLGRDSRIVIYTFNANGRFCASRRAVLSVLTDPRSKHAYFSKLELSFGTPEASPPKAKAIEAGKRFLQVLIPLLVKDHWPDWDKVIKESYSESA